MPLLRAALGWWNAIGNSPKPSTFSSIDSSENCVRYSIWLNYDWQQLDRLLYVITGFPKLQLSPHPVPTSHTPPPPQILLTSNPICKLCKQLRLMNVHYTAQLTLCNHWHLIYKQILGAIPNDWAPIIDSLNLWLFRLMIRNWTLAKGWVQLPLLLGFYVIFLSYQRLALYGSKAVSLSASKVPLLLASVSL